MVIEKVKHTASGAKVIFENGDVAEISTDDALEMRVRSGDEIDESALETLMEKARDHFAYKRAAASVAAGETSKKALYKKLLQKGAAPESAQKAVQRLSGMGFVDDMAYACRLCENYGTARHYAKRRVLQELAAHGIGRDTALEAAETCLLPDEENIALYFEAKLRNTDFSDEKAKRRAVNALVRAGYNYDTVNAFLREYEG